jgi:hypothetical protein
VLSVKTMTSCCLFRSKELQFQFNNVGSSGICKYLHGWVTSVKDFEWIVVLRCDLLLNILGNFYWIFLGTKIMNRALLTSIYLVKLPILCYFTKMHLNELNFVIFL